MSYCALSTAAALVLHAGVVFGQTSQPADGRANQPELRDNPEGRGVVLGRRVQASALVPVDWVIGTRVLGQDRERLGELNELVIDAQRGRARYGILQHGGMLGVGETTIPVPWSSLEWDPINRLLTLPFNSERLNDAPRMDGDDWQRLGDPQWRAKFDEFFSAGASAGGGVEGRWLDLVQEGQSATIRGTIKEIETREPIAGLGQERVLRVAADDGREWQVFVGPSWFVDRQRSLFRKGQDVQVRAARINIEGRETLVAKAINTSQGSFRFRDDQGRPVWDVAAEVREDARRKADRRDERVRDREGERRDQVVRLRDLKGQRIVDDDENEVGRIDTIVFNPQNGKLGYIVLSSGGFLGVKDERIAVPWKQFKVNQQGRVVASNIDRERVRTAPKIETRNWSELSDPDFARRVYQHFGASQDWDRDDAAEDRLLEADVQPGADTTQEAKDKAAREEQERARKQVLDHATELQRKFAQGAAMEFSGTVTRIDRQAVNGVVDFVVSTDKGERVVKLVPAAALDPLLRSVAVGQTVTVRGKQADIGERRVIIAQDVTVGRDKVNLRDRNGYLSGGR